VAARIHYTVHGRGRGHATRTVPVVRALERAGCEVLLFAGDDAAPVLAEAGLAPRSVESLRPDRLRRIPAALLSRTRDAVAGILRDRAHLVVSDGDLPALLAAAATGRPSIAVGHAEAFAHCRRPPGVPVAPWLREAARARASAPRAAVYVAVSFVALATANARTVVARPTLDPRMPQRTAAGDRVVCYFRDDNGTRAVAALCEAGERPIVFGRRPEPVSGAEWRPVERRGFLEALARARAVVASAGSQLISECVALGVPMFALHAPHDDEQRLNVHMLRAAGRGDGCSFAELNPADLASFLAAIARPALARPPLDQPRLDVADAVVGAVRDLSPA
jgi:UDP:flavonoid glycosyltransferase YjiC (YdhE family)